MIKNSSKLIQALKLLSTIGSFFIFRLPELSVLAALILIAFNLYEFFVKAKPLTLTTDLLVSGLVITATLAVLGFTYALVQNDKKSQEYKEIIRSSERLFHATIVIIQALLIFWFISQVYNSSLQKIYWFKYINWVLYLISFLSYLLLLDGAKYFHEGISKFENILRKKLSVMERY
ncbi:hypothetical protein HYV85_04260 [Candidatus Woesearchaeota archaeon]|nr:hypothetical protein [Candidatus Woesearchaeota archaeon]